MLDFTNHIHNVAKKALVIVHVELAEAEAEAIGHWPSSPSILPFSILPLSPLQYLLQH